MRKDVRVLENVYDDVCNDNRRYDEYPEVAKDDADNAAESCNRKDVSIADGKRSNTCPPDSIPKAAVFGEGEQGCGCNQAEDIDKRRLA